MVSLGFPSVEAYYAASNPLQLLPEISKPSLIIYAADNPLFHPDLVSDLQSACSRNPNIDLLVTPCGGHIRYLNSKHGQRQAQDHDVWWAENRVLQWLNYKRNN